MRSVLPLETRSTIASARPRRGATSTEPVTADELGLYTVLSEHLAGETRKDRGDPHPIQIRELGRSGLLRHCRLERAAAEAEAKELADGRPALPNEISARNPTIDDGVLNVLGNVLRPDEEHVDRCVATREREGAFAGSLGPQPGVLEEGDRGLAQPALGRDRDLQSFGRPVARSSARR